MNVPIIPGNDPVTIGGRQMDELLREICYGEEESAEERASADRQGDEEPQPSRRDQGCEETDARAAIHLAQGWAMTMGPVPTLADLRPGDLMFGPIGGFIPGVIPVGAGQIVLATRKARLSWRRWWKVRHVGVVVKATPTPFPHLVQYPFQPLPPRLVQAMPSGAEEIEMTAARHWTAEYVYLRPAYPAPPKITFGGEDISSYLTDMPYHVAKAARGYVGTPYNFLTYGKLAASALHLPTGLLRKWISTRHDMMCSQLADQALADAGFHVFNDGRLPQDVVPAELFRALLEMPGTRMLVPGGQWVETVS